MITFKQQITVSEELVNALAIDLGYKPMLTRQIQTEEFIDPAPTEEYPNPQSAEEFIDNLSKQHTINFFKPFGDKLVAQEIAKLGFAEQEAQARTQLEAQIITPVVESLTTEVVVD